MKTKTHQTGFTVIELMIAVLVTAIVLTIAVPSFRSLMQNNRAASQANQLVSSLNVARSEAVKRGRAVQICVDDNLANNACSGTNWHAGWRVWSDDDGDATVDNDETIVIGEPLGGGSTLTSSSAGLNTILYQPNGFVTAVPAGLTFALRMPDCTGNSNRDIAISLTGRPSISDVVCP